MTLDRAHALGGRVKHDICKSNPRIQSVLVHMEPFVGNHVSRIELRA